VHAFFVYVVVPVAMAGCSALQFPNLLFFVFFWPKRVDMDEWLNLKRFLVGTP
jgi:hypothetical protein